MKYWKTITVLAVIHAVVLFFLGVGLIGYSLSKPIPSIVAKILLAVVGLLLLPFELPLSFLMPDLVFNPVLFLLNSLAFSILAHTIHYWLKRRKKSKITPPPKMNK